MRSFIVLSALLVATTVVQAVNITDGDDYMCTGSTEGSGCYGALLDVASDSAFSLQCKDASSCRNSHIVVHSGCTLKPAGIDCTPNFACRDAEIVVYSSNLATHSNRYLDCFNSASGGICRDMNLTLVDSSIMLYCGYNDCDYMKVFLFGSSTLELKPESVMHWDVPNNALTIYLYDPSQLIDNGVTGYNLVTMTYPPTTTSTMTPTSTRLLPTTMTPTMTSTLIPSTTTLTTSTTTIIPQTTTQIRMTTTKPTAIPSVTSAYSTPNPTASQIPKSTISHTSVTLTNGTGTRTSTVLSTAHPTDGGGNGHSIAISSALLFAAAIGGGVVLLLAVACVCGIYIGIKYCGSGKHEQGEDEKDANVQIALVSRTQSQASGQLHEDSGNAAHGSKWVVAEEKVVEEQTTEGQTADGNPDAVPTPEVSLEIMYCEMPKNHTRGGYLPHSPEGCQRQVEGGAYGTP